MAIKFIIMTVLLIAVIWLLGMMPSVLIKCIASAVIIIFMYVMYRINKEEDGGCF